MERALSKTKENLYGIQILLSSIHSEVLNMRSLLHSRCVYF
jgi:hypothetical protein